MNQELGIKKTPTTRVVSAAHVICLKQNCLHINVLLMQILPACCYFLRLRQIHSSSATILLKQLNGSHFKIKGLTYSAATLPVADAVPAVAVTSLPLASQIFGYL